MLFMTNFHTLVEQFRELDRYYFSLQTCKFLKIKDIQKMNLILYIFAKRVANSIFNLMFNINYIFFILTHLKKSKSHP